MTNAPIAHPPETAEGWYALHQIFRITLPQSSDMTPSDAAIAAFTARADTQAEGWSLAVRLIGSTSDIMFIHMRPTLDGIGEAQRQLAREPWMGQLTPVYSFLSITEAGLYRLTADAARDAAARGGAVGDEAYRAAIAEGRERDVNSDHVQRRLYPQPPASMPYVCFYPMSKRRAVGQNWYALPIDERNRLMQEHGLTGRKYAGKVLQIISGSIGFEQWEWGVTLFAGDPLAFKKLVSEMRFDEASAQYAEFGDFFVGRAGTLADTLAPASAPALTPTR